MPALLGRAERSIRVAFFLFGGPHADAMIDVLAQKAARGVDVQIVLDNLLGYFPPVRRECARAFARMKRLGLSVTLSDKGGGLAHHKIIVIDNREALVGGMNVGTLFFRFHDAMIHLQGPASAALSRLFDTDPRFAHRPDAPPFCGPVVPDETRARIVGTGAGSQTTRTVLLQNIAAARTSIAIALCEMGASDVLDAVLAAHAQRGVPVRVLLDPLRLDAYLPPLPASLRRRVPRGVLNAGALAILLTAGVPVRLYDNRPHFTLMHLKMAVFDSQSAVIGSTNWTRGGFGWVGETDVELHGGPVIGQLLAQFERDWSEASVPAAMPTRVDRLWCRLYERLTQQSG